MNIDWGQAFFNLFMGLCGTMTILVVVMLILVLLHVLLLMTVGVGILQDPPQ